MNREDDILSRTRFLIQGIKDYTDNRIDKAVEDAVRRTFEERRRIRNETVATIIKCLVLILCLGCVCVVLITVIDAPNRSTFQLIAAWVAAVSWFVLFVRWATSDCDQNDE